MIALTAKMKIEAENPLPFTLGVSKLGEGSLFGEKIDVVANFDRRNLLSLESGITDRGDIQLPSWGIISNVGSMEFKDKYSRFFGYANAGLLKEGMKVKIFLENTLSDSIEEAGTYYTANWEYDNNNRSVSVSLKDDLEEWQELLIDSIEYDFSKMQEKNLKWFYDELYKLTPSKYGMRAFENLDSSTQSVLSSTYIKYPYLVSESLWNSWEKLCEVALLHIYKDNEETICRYNGGN